MKICPRCSVLHEKPGTYCSRSCANVRVISDEQKQKVSQKMQGFWKNNPESKVWTEERRQSFSAIMKQAVLNNPDSYSKNNVSGRVKMYCVDSTMGPTKVKGKWELAVANYLNNNLIEWTNNIIPFKYYWNNSWHNYFPDFYLNKLDLYLEVKGYKTDRDEAKWSVIPNLIVLYKEDVEKISV